MLLYDLLLVQVSAHITVIYMKWQNFIVLKEKKKHVNFYFKSFGG